MSTFCHVVSRKSRAVVLDNVSAGGGWGSSLGRFMHAGNSSGPCHVYILSRAAWVVCVSCCFFEFVRDVGCACVFCCAVRGCPRRRASAGRVVSVFSEVMAPICCCRFHCLRRVLWVFFVVYLCVFVLGGVVRACSLIEYCGARVLCIQVSLWWVWF